MKYWEWCEQETIRLSGGRPTPRSGGGRIKGDIRLYQDGWYIEVKSTENKNYANLKYQWFKTLEKVWGLDVCLVFWFGDRTGGMYLFERNDRNICESWSTMKVFNGQLPKIINTPNGIWKLQELQELKKLKEI